MIEDLWVGVVGLDAKRSKDCKEAEGLPWTLIFFRNLKKKQQ